MTRQEHERLLATEQRKTEWERDQAKQAEEARLVLEKKLRLVRRALSRMRGFWPDGQFAPPGSAMGEANAALDETKEYQ